MADHSNVHAPLRATSASRTASPVTTASFEGSSSGGASSWPTLPSWTTVAALGVGIGVAAMAWKSWRGHQDHSKPASDEDDVDAAILEAVGQSRVPAGMVEFASPLLSPDGISAPPILLPKPFVEKYELHNVLGTGLTSIVLAATEIATGRHCAVKIIHKTKLEPGMLEYIEREVRLLAELDHPNIIRLYDVYKTQEHVLIVMERAMGGELYDRLAFASSYTEEDAKTAIREIVSAIMYLHGKGIIHRDLKPENLLLSSPDSDTGIKICDFGLAKWFNSDVDAARTGSAYPIPALTSERLRTAASAGGGGGGTDPSTPPPPPALLRRASTVCGSALYHAPEVESADYDFACDYYSLGIILHFMLVGFIPERDEQLCADPDWDDISPAAQDLVKRLLDPSPRTRITGPGILAHAWIAGSSLSDRPTLLRAQTSMGNLYVQPRAAALDRTESLVVQFVDRLGKNVLKRLPSTGNPADGTTKVPAMTAPMKDRFASAPAGRAASAAPPILQQRFQDIVQAAVELEASSVSDEATEKDPSPTESPSPSPPSF